MGVFTLQHSGPGNLAVSLVEGANLHPAWVGADVATWKHDEVLEHLRDLIFLQSDLPPGSFQEVVDEGQMKVKQFWTQGYNRLCDGEAGVECKLLQDLVSEGCSNWPGDAFFAEAQRSLLSS